MLALNEYDPLVRDNLLEDCIEGMNNFDKDALVNFYEMTCNAIYSFILSIIKNKHDAEDIFQDVYIKIYESTSKYQKKGKPLAWILTIVKNSCLEFLRKQKNHSNIDDLYDVGFTDKEKKKIEDRMLIDTIFINITEEERNIIILHIVSGMRFIEIAKFLNLPLSTVLSKYHRAIKKVKKVFEEDIK